MENNVTEENGWRGRMEERLNNLVTKFDQHIEHHPMEFQCNVHTEEIRDMKKTVDWIRNRMWLAMGALAILQIIGFWTLFERITKVVR